MNEEKIYPISLSPSYCKDWDVQSALREICQNMLDSGGGDVDYDESTETLTITNYNAQIPSQYLLLGNGSKSDNDRGGFSEGGKIAWLILTRLGHEVSIENGNVLWTPYYDHSKLFGCDMLHVSETPLDGNSDVRYTITNIDQDTYNEMCSRCLFLVDDLEIIEETCYGNILENKDDQGKLYVGGLYVCNTDMDYTYDIKPQYLKLNRDRQTPEHYDLKSIVKSIWVQADKKELAADMLFNSSSDAYLFTHTYENEIPKAVYQKYTEEYGENIVVADDDDEKQSLIKEGYSNIIVTGKSDFNDVLRKSKDYQAGIESAKEYVEEYSPDEVLSLFSSQFGDVISKEELDVLENIIELFIDKRVDCGYSNTITKGEIPFEFDE